MKTLSIAVLVLLSAQTLRTCELPVVFLQYGFESNVTQISGSLGSFIRLQCIANPLTDVASYIWEKNGDNLSAPSQYYTITSLETEDGGLYRCGVVTTSCGTVHSPEVSINTAPDDVMASGPSSVTEGQPFQLTCSAIGWPLPLFAWTLDGIPVEMDSEYSVASASTSDSGEYTCVARNIRGESAATLDLTVEGTRVTPTRTNIPLLSPSPVSGTIAVQLESSTGNDEKEKTSLATDVSISIASSSISDTVLADDGDGENEKDTPLIIGVGVGAGGVVVAAAMLVIIIGMIVVLKKTRKPTKEAPVYDYITYQPPVQAAHIQLEKNIAYESIHPQVAVSTPQVQPNIAYAAVLH